MILPEAHLYQGERKLYFFKSWPVLVEKTILDPVSLNKPLADTQQSLP